MKKNKNHELETDDPFADHFGSVNFTSKLISLFRSKTEDVVEKITPETSRRHLVKNKFRYYIDEIGILKRTNLDHKFGFFILFVFLIPLFLFEICIVLVRAKDPNIFQSLKKITANKKEEPKLMEHVVGDIELENDVLEDIELDELDLEKLELKDFNIEEPALGEIESEETILGDFELEKSVLGNVDIEKSILEEPVLGTLDIEESILEEPILAKQKIKELGLKVPELEETLLEELALGEIDLEEPVKIDLEEPVEIDLQEPIIEELNLEKSILEDLGFEELAADESEATEPLLEIEEVPPQLRDLASMAVKWGIGDEDHRENIMKSASIKELVDLTAIVGPRMQEIADWLETLNDDQIKESDSATFFLFLMSAYDDAPLYTMEEIT